jgi:uncharacterized protein
LTPPLPDYAADIERWRRRRIERLTAEDGWLALSGFFWLAEGVHAVGSATGSDVLLPPGSPPHAGDLRVSREGIVFEPAAGARVKTSGRLVSRAIAVITDAGDAPTVLRAGGAAFQVVERGGRFAARVRDRDSPARRDLRPIPHFPVDPAWRIAARFEPYDPPKRFPMTSILGTAELETSPGAVWFEAGGRTLRLEPILERGEADYWIVFADLTSGRETYAGGRFVYVPPARDGHTVLDFNKAYNPPCVFTPHSTCPLPPPQNRLPIRVEAGEKTYA